MTAQPASAQESGSKPFPRPSTRQVIKPAVAPYFGAAARTVAITLAAEPWRTE